MVTESGWKWLWASITSKRYFRNPVISATFKTDPSGTPTQHGWANAVSFSPTFKTDPSGTPTQPHILEEGLGLINQGLNQITQGLAVNM
jgi:hypothetical protein